MTQTLPAVDGRRTRLPLTTWRYDTPGRRYLVSGVNGQVIYLVRERTLLFRTLGGLIGAATPANTVSATAALTYGGERALHGVLLAWHDDMPDVGVELIRWQDLDHGRLRTWLG